MYYTDSCSSLPDLDLGMKSLVAAIRQWKGWEQEYYAVAAMSWRKPGNETTTIQRVYFAVELFFWIFHLCCYGQKYLRKLTWNRSQM